MTDFVDRVAQKISEDHVNMDFKYVRRSKKLEEGRGKRGQMKHADSDYSDEWGDNNDSMRKRDKPKFRVKKKKAVWDD